MFVRRRGSTSRPGHLRTGPDERERTLSCARTAPSPLTSQREWHVIDATDIVLGRLAVQTANLLRGKHKPTFAPHMDMGDFVIVVNAEKVALSGDKKTTKLAYRHSGYPGGLTATPIGDLLEKDARKVIEKAVWGMLPKNKLGRQIMKKLKVYSGPDAPARGPEGHPLRDHPDLPVVVDQSQQRTYTVTSESTEAPSTERRAPRSRRPTPPTRGCRLQLRERAERRGRRRPPGDHRARRGHRPPQGGRRPRPDRPRHRRVDRQRPRRSTPTSPTSCTSRSSTSRSPRCQLEGRFDVIARIHGGGITGQAGALRLGVARCLNAIDEEANRPSLKKAGLLTRDARVIERKKAGLKKARKAPQFSKR